VAACDGNKKEVEDLLVSNPNLDVNWQNEESFGRPAALHRACAQGEVAIVSLLLAHPDIDVNVKDDDGFTPFLCACLGGQTSCARLLLWDTRVRVSEVNRSGTSALWWTTFLGHVDII